MAASLGRSLTAVKLKFEICEAYSMVTGERKQAADLDCIQRWVSVPGKRLPFKCLIVPACTRNQAETTSTA